MIRAHKRVLGWNMENIQGMDLLFYTYHVALVDDGKPIRQMQCRLNPTMKEVSKLRC